MSKEEKQISFMNRYFVFRKVRDVDVKKMAHLISKDADFNTSLDEASTKELEKELEKEVEKDAKEGQSEKGQGQNDSSDEEEERFIEPVKQVKRLVLKKDTDKQPDKAKPVVSIGTEKMVIKIKK